MNKIYLVCTRSAISASALTYVINSSPDFYNLCHNNLWLEEHSETFGTAHIINDWWNVSDQFKTATGYDKVIRNTEALDEDELVQLARGFEELDLGKNICIFTHARNLEEIREIRDKHDLPIVLVSTVIGKDSYYFMSSWLRREYNELMNEYDNIFSSWQYLYTQRIFNDDMWSDHMDHVFKMYDWLKRPDYVYDTLGVAQNKHMKIWTDQYLLRNDSLYLENDLDTIVTSEGIRYKLMLMMYIYDHIEDMCTNSHSKIKTCCKIYNMINSGRYKSTQDCIEACKQEMYLT